MQHTSSDYRYKYTPFLLKKQTNNSTTVQKTKQKIYLISQVTSKVPYHTSSINTTQGARRLASVNTALAFFSLSPSHLFSITLASTLRKVAPPSVATALASIVFPVPGELFMCNCCFNRVVKINTTLVKSRLLMYQFLSQQYKVSSISVPS